MATGSQRQRSGGFRREDYATLIEDASVGFFQSTRDGQLTEANPALRQILGYRDEELPSVIDIAELFVVVEERHRWQELMRQGTVVSGFEAQWRRHGETVIWVRIDAVPVRDAEEQTVSYAGTVADINSLREDVNGLRWLLGEAPIGYHEIDEQGCITYINQAELGMLGCSKEDAIGQPVWNFVREQRGRHTSEQAVRDKLAGRKLPGHAFFRTYLRKDGRTTVPMLFEDRLLKNNEGRITGIRTTCADMSVGPLIAQWLRNPEIGSLKVLEDHPVCVFRKDRDGRFTYANSRFCDEGIMRPYSDVRGKTDRECGYPEEVARKFLEDDAIVFNCGQVIEMIERYACPRSNDRYWIHVVKSPIYDVDRKVVEVQGMYWRVTDRQRIVNALGAANVELAKRLNEAEGKYRRITANEDIGAYSSRPDGEFTEVNVALSKMYGYNSPEDMLRDAGAIRRWRDGGKEGEKFHQFLEIMRRDGKISGWEYEIRRRDGAPVWASECAWVVRDRAGHVQFHEGVVENITARKLSQERERYILANANDIIYTHEFNYDKPLDARFTSVNGNAVKKILGYTEQEFCQKRLNEIIPDDYRPEIKKIITTRSSKAIPFFVEVYHKENHRVLLEINASRRKGLNGKWEIHGVGRDASRRRLQEIETRLVTALRYAVGLDSPSVLAIAVRRVLCALTVSDGLKAHRAMFFQWNEGLFEGLCAVGPRNKQQAGDYSRNIGRGNITFGAAMTAMDSPDFRHPDELHWDVSATKLSLKSFGEEAGQLIGNGKSDRLNLQDGARDEMREFIDEHDIGEVLLCPVVGGGGLYGVLILDCLYQGREHELPPEREVEQFAHFLPELLLQGKYIHNQEHMLVHGIRSLGGTAQDQFKVLNRQKMSRDGKKAIAALQSINRQTQATVDAILSLTKRRLELGNVDVNELIKTIKAARDFAKIDVSGLDRSDPRARCDERQLRLILNELIDNAHKWRKRGQTYADITIETQVCDSSEVPADVQVFAGQRYVRIIFSDKGKGISPAVRDDLFTLYVHGSVAGNGIGLASARSALCSQHGGIVETSSGEEGARFEIFLPSARRKR